MTTVAEKSRALVVWLTSLAAVALLLALAIRNSEAHILRVLLVADCILLFVAALYIRRFGLRFGTYEPLWNPQRAESSNWISTRFSLIVWTLILLGLVLRVIGLNSDLWMDEVFTLVETIRLSFSEILTTYDSDNQHTLYSILAKSSVLLFGESAWSVRLPAMLFGVASIWALARVSRLTFGAREAILAALVCTFLYHHIWFSQNARGYTILLFTTLLATDCLLRGLHSGQWKYWISYAVLIALGAFAHLISVFVAVGHFMVIAALIARDRQLRPSHWRPISAIVLSGWITLHLYALTIIPIVSFFTRTKNTALIVEADWTNPLWLISETLREMGLINAIGWPGIIVVLIAGVWVGYLFLRRDSVFTLVAFMPAVITVLVLVVLGRNLWPRMFFYELGFLVLFIVAALVAFADYVKARMTPDNPRLSPALMLLSVLLLCAASISMFPKLYNYPKQDYQAARDFVIANANPGDQVLGLHMAGRVYRNYYAPQWPDVYTAEEVADYQSRGGDTWLLYTLPKFVNKAYPELAAMLEKDFEIVRVFPGSLSDGEIVVSRSKQKDTEQK